MAKTRQLHGDFFSLWGDSEWPDILAMQSWLRMKQMPGTGNDGHSGLRQGKPVSAIYVKGFIAYVCRDRSPDTSDEVARRQWSKVRSYLELKGHTDSRSYLIDEIVSYVSCAADNRHQGSVSDWFLNPFEVITSMYTCQRIMKRNPWESVAMCSDKPAERMTQINDVVRWVFIALGRDVKGSTRLSEDEAIEAAEQFLDCTRAAFRDRVISWYDVSPWTIVRCHDGKRITGGIITLPLKEDVYYDIRAGRRPTFACEPGDLSSTSSFLLAQAMAPRPFAKPISRAQFSRSALPAIVCQQARLSALPGIAKDIPLYILAPSGTRMNTTIMRLASYRPTRTTVYGIPHVKFMERKFHLRADDIDRTIDAKMIGAWLLLQDDLARLDAQGALCER